MWITKPAIMIRTNRSFSVQHIIGCMTRHSTRRKLASCSGRIGRRLEASPTPSCGYNVDRVGAGRRHRRNAIQPQCLVCVLYPTAMRSIGSGWAYGVRRINAILGPTLGDCRQSADLCDVSDGRGLVALRLHPLIILHMLRPNAVHESEHAAPRPAEASAPNASRARV